MKLITEYHGQLAVFHLPFDWLSLATQHLRNNSCVCGFQIRTASAHFFESFKLYSAKLYEIIGKYESVNEIDTLNK